MGKNNCMNWYKKIIAQNMMAYLESIGANPNIVQFITSQDPINSQLLTNEFRKNPGLTIEQLEQLKKIQSPQEIDPYLEIEKDIANTGYQTNPMFVKWILVSFRKLRKGKIPRQRATALLQEILTPKEVLDYFTFKETLHQIYDWYRFTNPDMSFYSPEKAIQASKEWHQMMARKGEGEIYEPTNPNLIVYGPEWKNAELQGWTIQRIMSENDLQVEGNRMNHCVGSYCEDVKSEYSIIYSLRDPNNNPHVTIESDGSDYVRQIRGNSDSIPKKKYQSMIKEWIESDKNPGLYEYEDDSDPLGKISVSYGTAQDILDAIEIVQNDDYGLQRTTSLGAVDIMNTSLEIMDQMREPQFWGDWRYVPEASIDMTLKLYKNNPEKLISKIKDLEKELYKKEEEINEYAFMNWETGEGYPQEENYENRKEFEEAEEEFQEQESDWISEEIRKTPDGGYAHEALSYINKLREEGKIPLHTQTPVMTSHGLNWYKKAQQYAPIAIVSYNQTYNELGISFNRGPKYTYYGVNPYYYNKIENLLNRKNYKAAEKILRNFGKNKPQYIDPKPYKKPEQKQFPFMENRWYGKILLAQIWNTGNTGSFEDNLKAMYELEYKLQAFKNFKWKGNPERLQNIMTKLEEEIWKVIEELKGPLLQTFSAWLSSHALLDPQKWAEQRIIDPYGGDYIEELGTESAFRTVIDEYKRYQNYNQDWHNYTKSTNWDAELGEMISLAFDNIDQYPSLQNVKQVYIQGEKEILEDELYSDGIEEFGLNRRNEKFQTEEEAESWIENYIEEFDTAELIDNYGIEVFINVFQQTGTDIKQLFVDLYKNLVFPLWFDYWRAMGIEETREIVHNAYNRLEEAQSLNQHTTAINNAIDTTHQTGDMIDYMETYAPDEKIDTSSIKATLEELSSSSFVPEWHKQLSQVGISIPRAATR